jgi:hypothetical protein
VFDDLDRIDRENHPAGTRRIERGAVGESVRASDPVPKCTVGILSHGDQPPDFDVTKGRSGIEDCESDARIPTDVPVFLTVLGGGDKDACPVETEPHGRGVWAPIGT